MPVLKGSALYNCRVLLLNSQIILIRPKTRLALNGNYRESRWFTAWDDGNTGFLVWYQLPSIITQLNGQVRVPFGDKAILEICDSNADPFIDNKITIGFEICEELWQTEAQHINLYGRRGCLLVFNSSASYWEIRKLNHAIDLIRTATFKSGGAYVFSNLVGCDGGGRLCFYGRSSIVMNGDILTMTTSDDSLFDEIQTTVAYIDPNDITQYRLQNNLRTHTHKGTGNCVIFDARTTLNYNECSNDIHNATTINITGFNVLKAKETLHLPTSLPSLTVEPEKEIMLYCSLWLWDYFRRCIGRGLQGFIVPLSGGLDSASVAVIVYSLCTLLYKQFNRGNKQIINNLKLIFKNEDINETIKSPKDICNRILKCVYLGTRYSGKASLQRAEDLAKLINCKFVAHDFDNIFELIQKTVPIENQSIDNKVTLGQQNVQARLRMVLTYYFSEGNRLVLATGNVDEALVGYLTKYDCSSADLNPIGSISKHDLKNFMKFCKSIIPESDDVLDAIINAIPSAELTGENQSDEEDLGLTYDELSVFGRMRRGQFGTYGPYGVFCKIWAERKNPMIYNAIKELENNPNPELIAKKVKRFFTLYASNRHKQTVLTPALHSESYSPDDNRFDHRQFLFDTQWKWQFAQIDIKVNQLMKDLENKN